MIRGLVRLFRLRLALLNGVAAAGGVLLFPLPTAYGLLLSVFIGVVLLAAGGSALNQAQEYELDRLMSRTRLRPVASGSLTPAMAVLLGAVAVMAGVFVIGVSGGLLRAMIGAGGILWYLAVYTPLKTRTPYALAAGALCGVVPPVIGWCSAGGSMLDYRIILLAGILYLWQIPHFWLFQRRYAADYHAAGFPLLAAPYRSNRLFSIFGLWILALITAATLLPALNLVISSTAIWYSVLSLPLLVLTLLHSEKLLFTYLNTFPLLITVTLIIQKNYP